ncbi:PQ loop repeat-domain-containing protein [Hysterangium stoloniferum]|nr:PQ loop repeat-domain-containing protein [Hysterangium stoloniferum]
MAREEIISVVLGYVSIGCWLGAQFPQIIVNLRRKSVDGLALPFLANWLLGDTTNLIGCILTDQLPFQTYLATYFVIVDICLVSQYLYYDAPRDAQALSVLTSPSVRTSLALPSPHDSYFPRTRIPRARSSSYSADPGVKTAVSSLAQATSDVHPDALASEAELPASQSRRRPRADDESESAPSIMIDSFQSEGGGLGRNKGKHVSWTRESTSRDRDTRAMSQDPPASQPPSPQTAPATMRGRQLTRPTIYDSPTTSDASAVQPTRERRISEASIVSAAASRRSASIVFLGVFALFGLSSRAGYRPFGASPSEGRVLQVLPTPEATSAPLQLANVPHVSSSDAVVRLQESGSFVSVSFAAGDTKKAIGHISAWTCTTLYITSRLPQIWKNYVRKSVEGLSIYLFIFAFLGNFFYVLSILANPKMDLPPPLAKQFLRDSIPYLLGSGGTLIFDVTIVLQSFVYAPSKRALRARARRKSLMSAGGEEERALLAGDADER